MARFVYALMQSLDGYVSGPEGSDGLPMPDDALNEHFSVELDRMTGSFYARRMYEIMRYWDSVDPVQEGPGRAFAAAWQAKPKFVASRTLDTVGPNATLVRDLEPFARKLKAEHEGEVEIAGPELAAALSALGLIDEYQLYLRPVVLGGGKPFFAGPRPPLQLVSSERLSQDTMRLVYVPA